MRRFTVLGFTEAELGFVLAALFAAVAVQAVEAGKAKESAVQDAAVVAMQRDSIAREFKEFRDSVAKLPVVKRSSKVPQCWEKGEQRDPIATLRVLGANRYELAGQEMTITGVRERLAAQIARSDSLKCRYVVRAQLTRGVDAVDQARAVWSLRTHFDVNDRPQ
jgi:hypothetical protein